MCSQRSTICPYLQPDISNPKHPILFLRSTLKEFFNLVCLSVPSDLFPSGFPTKLLYARLFSRIYPTCPVPCIQMITLKQIEKNSTLPSIFFKALLIMSPISFKYYILIKHPHLRNKAFPSAAKRTTNKRLWSASLGYRYKCTDMRLFRS
jgi:hypothetical protein